MSRFFTFLELIIESKDFAFEENLRVFELVQTKLENLTIPMEKIRKTVISKSVDKDLKILLEEFFYAYYKFKNLLFKRELYQVDIIKDTIKFFSIRWEKY